MELTENSTWILPAMELNLCLRMLGAAQRTVLPVAESEQSLNRRMLNGFLHLLELGLVEPEGELFRPTAKMRARLEPIARPRAILRLGSAAGGLLSVYLGEDAVTLAEAAGEDGQSCRLDAAERETLERELERALDAQGIAGAVLELLGPDGRMIEKTTLPDGSGPRQEALRSALERAEEETGRAGGRTE